MFFSFFLELEIFLELEKNIKKTDDEVFFYKKLSICLANQNIQLRTEINFFNIQLKENHE